MFETSTAAPQSPDIESIDSEIATLAAQLDAASYRLLTLIDKYDAEEGWAEGGFRSCAHYLNWRIGLALGAAREHVRVAKALPSLPRISEALRCGRLSYSKVRAMTRVATAENEEGLLSMALTATASQVEKIVRATRRCQGAAETRDEANRQHEDRYLFLHTEEDGSLRLEGRLSPEFGSELKKALELAMEALARAAASGDDEVARAENIPAGTRAQRQADALVHLARSAMHQQMEAGANADRMQVVLRAESAPMDDIALADGTPLAADTARRLCCDISLVEEGKKRRLPTTLQRRALQERDGGCAFPGCAHERFLQAHHIEHWSDGGETTLDNMVLLCSFHHRLVHEGGFACDRDAEGRITFSNAQGVTIEEAPARPLAWRRLGSRVGGGGSARSTGLAVKPQPK